MQEKTYVIVVQCDRVTHDVCPGFQCEHAFNARADAFSEYPADRKIRYMAISCGGCPGIATLRKLVNFKKNYKNRESGQPDAVVVHLSSCITKSNHHGPRCPHIDYIKGQIRLAGLDCVEGTRYSPKAEKRRAMGIYKEKEDEQS